MMGAGAGASAPAAGAARPRGRVGYLTRWGDLIIALTYLWEGQVLLAEQFLRRCWPKRRPTSGGAAVRLHAGAARRGVLGARPAPTRRGAAANRLDVLERTGSGRVLFGYPDGGAGRDRGGQAENRATQLLGVLDAVGATRLPRLRIASLTDQVRCTRAASGPDRRDLSHKSTRCSPSRACRKEPLWQRSARMLRNWPRRHAAIAAQDWRRALRARPAPTATPRGSSRACTSRPWIARVGARPLHGKRLRPARGDRAGPVARPARVFGDATALGEWVASRSDGARRPWASARGRQPRHRRPALARAPATPRATPSMALTPKEREVLELLARNLSNKEIGLTMNIHEDTVKWHVKNLSPSSARHPQAGGIPRPS